MEQAEWDGLFFVDSVKDYDFTGNFDHILHILCVEGSISFIFHDVRYNVIPGDYVILTNSSLASSFSESSDFKAIIMSISESFVTSMALRSNYGIIGHLSLLQNPVMRLSATDFLKCREDLRRIRERLQEKNHLFHEEMLGHLLMAHILDLYDIHARGQDACQVPNARSFFYNNSLNCCTRVNTSNTGICLIMPRVFALRPIICPKYARR